MRIKLTSIEMALAAQVGAMRHITSLRDRRTPGFGCAPEDGWSKNIEGAAGEMVVAKGLGLYWPATVQNFGKGFDVANLQVRTNNYVNNFELIIRPKDADDQIFVGVVGLCPEFEIAGWILGKNGKRHEWSYDANGRPPIFKVPRAALEPVDTLKDVMTLQGYDTSR